MGASQTSGAAIEDEALKLLLCAGGDSTKKLFSRFCADGIKIDTVLVHYWYL
jgi:hypothetical protein